MEDLRCCSLKHYCRTRHSEEDNQEEELICYLYDARSGRKEGFPENIWLVLQKTGCWTKYASGLILADSDVSYAWVGNLQPSRSFFTPNSHQLQTMARLDDICSPTTSGGPQIPPKLL